MVITSTDNKVIKDIIKLKQKKYRDQEEKFIVEGIKMVQEIPEGWNVDRVIIVEEEKHKFAEIVRRFSNDIIVYVSEIVFRKITDTEEPQGIMAICSKRQYNIDDVLSRKNINVFLLEEIQDPGNLGTIIRTADATKVDAILISKGSVDLYNPKTIRSTMASIFHIPIITSVEIDDIANKLKDNNIKIMATSLNTNLYLYDINLDVNTCIVIGNEAKGISKLVEGVADELFKIPMPGQAESLNASVASSVVMYEILRQRGWSVHGSQCTVHS